MTIFTQKSKKSTIYGNNLLDTDDPLSSNYKKLPLVKTSKFMTVEKFLTRKYHTALSMKYPTTVPTTYMKYTELLTLTKFVQLCIINSDLLVYHYNNEVINHHLDDNRAAKYPPGNWVIT